VVEEITALQERLLLAFEAMELRYHESRRLIEQTRRLVRRSRASGEGEGGPVSSIRRRSRFKATSGKPFAEPCRSGAIET
jgi:hypothetical protein